MNWDTVRFEEVTVEALRGAKDEDFPETYSGITWKAARRMLLALGDDVEAIRSLDMWNFPKGVRESISGLDLTGFMVGCACGFLRQLYGASPGKSGAVIEAGVGPVDQPRLTGSAEEELIKAL